MKEQIIEWLLNQGFAKAYAHVYKKEDWYVGFNYKDWISIGHDTFDYRDFDYTGRILTKFETFIDILESNGFKVWRFGAWLMDQGFVVKKTKHDDYKCQSKKHSIRVDIYPKSGIFFWWTTDGSQKSESGKIPQSLAAAVELFQKYNIPLKEDADKWIESQIK